MAKRTDAIAFFKVENDGFDLGAQRRPIERNDLPKVQAELSAYLAHLRVGDVAKFKTTLGVVVGKRKIGENGEYNLSGERYRDIQPRATQWPMVPLEEIVDFESGSRQKGGAVDSGIPSIGGEHIDNKGNIVFEKMKYVSEEHFQGMKKGILQKGDVLVVKDGATTGKTGFFPSDLPAAVNEHVFILRVRESVDCYYLYSIARSEAFQESLKPFIKGIIGGISREIGQIRIPLPPPEMQREIVAEIESYQKIIDGARAVVENYRPNIVVDPEWPTMVLGELCCLGGSITTNVNLSLPYFGADSIEPSSGKLTKVETAQEQRVNGPVYEFSGERLRYSKIRPYLNKLAIVDLEGYCSADMYPLLPDRDKIDITYLATYMLSEEFNDSLRLYYERASIPKINRSQLFKVGIPVPSIETQESVVAEIRAEQALVEANRELIRRFEQKIQAAISRVWGVKLPRPNRMVKDDAQGRIHSRSWVLQSYRCSNADHEGIDPCG